MEIAPAHLLRLLCGRGLWGDDPHILLVHGRVLDDPPCGTEQGAEAEGAAMQRAARDVGLDKEQCRLLVRAQGGAEHLSSHPPGAGDRASGGTQGDPSSRAAKDSSPSQGIYAPPPPALQPPGAPSVAMASAVVIVPVAGGGWAVMADG